MAGSFDAHLKTDLDWVRHWTVDKTEPYRVPDETILAVLAVHPNKWLAAAELFQQNAVRSNNDEIIKKVMEDLEITYGGKSTTVTLEGHADWLKEQGTFELLRGRPCRILEVL